MKIGFIGLGKLGLPMALSFNLKGHDVIGYDIDPNRMTKKWFNEKELGPNGEDNFIELLQNSSLQFGTMEEVLKFGELIFVVVQTASNTGYWGDTPLPKKKKNYNLKPIKKCFENINDIVLRNNEIKETNIVLVSTVVPGTSREHFKSIFKTTKINYFYSPQLPAMGTVLQDINNAEFFIIGKGNYKSNHDGFSTDKCSKLEDFYHSTFSNVDTYVCSIESAEMIKTCYNSFISTKIGLANIWMEIAHKIPGADVDDVSECLSMATRRLLSPLYMRGGMGDAGPCLPAGEILYTENGITNIEDIKIGDKVLGIDGKFNTVIKTYEREFEGDLIGIKSRGLPWTYFTDNHEIFVSKDLRKKYKVNGRIKRYTSKKPSEKNTEIIKIPTKEINKDYYTIFPIINMDFSEEQISEKDKIFLNLGGYYLSEGCASGYQGKLDRVSFDFHEDEKEYINEVTSWLENYQNNKVTIFDRKDSKGISIRCYGQKISKEFVDAFGKGAENKFIPKDIIFGNNKIKAIFILRGLWRGDGSSHKQGFSLATISKQLAYGTSILLRRFGIMHSVQYHPERIGKKDKIKHKESWEVRVRNATDIIKLSKLIEMPIYHKLQKSRYESIFNDDSYFYHKIQKIKKIPFKGTVYNINAEPTHTYVASSGVVSNCHPKDNIGLAWLGKKLNLSFNWFEMIMKGREKQTKWLANLIKKELNKNRREVVILGTAFKAESNLEIGSSSILLYNLLKNKVKVNLYDPKTGRDYKEDGKPKVYLIGIFHEELKNLNIPKNSVVIDPWGKFPDKKDIKVIRVGRNN